MSLIENGETPPTTQPHKYIDYASSVSPSDIIQDLTRFLMRFYTNIDMSKSQWQKRNGMIEIGQQRITYRDIELNLSRERTFDYAKFGFSEPFCMWLDHDIDIALLNYTGIGIQFTTNLQPGSPVAVGSSQMPTLGIDRAGRLISSMQRKLQKRILDMRNHAVSNSSNLLEIEYLMDIRTLLGDIISLVDITLHQTYFKAENGPNPSWRPFDKERLEKACPRYGGRLQNKLKWIALITGNEPNFSQIELSAFNEIRELRNHFTHWDPPSFAYTAEDVVRWLNAIPSIGILLWKMRKSLGSPPTVPLIQLILGKRVQYQLHPNEVSITPPALSPGFGYGSCRPCRSA